MATLMIELPDAVLELMGPAAQAQSQAKEAVVFSLVRQGLISTGKAGDILGVNAWDLQDLIMEYQISMGPVGPEEIQQEFETARRLSDH